VQRARKNLIAQGRYPSVDAIRVELGNTGSKTTIQRYLREIAEEDGAQINGVPALSEAIQALAHQLAERLQSEADERLVQLEATHAEAIRLLQQQLEAVRSECVAAPAALMKANRDLEDAKQRHDDLAARLALESQARAQAQQQTTDLQIQLQAETRHRESIDAKYADARRSLEHFREAAKEQREREERKHEAEVQFLQQELRRLQAALTEAQARLTAGAEERVRLVGELEVLRHALQAFDRTKVELAATQDRLGTTMADREGLSRQLEAERRRSEALASDAQKAADERQRSDSRIRELESELAAAKAREVSAAHWQAQIDEQIRAQFGRLLQGVKKPARA
jgi:chromosome segregation ATPase